MAVGLKKYLKAENPHISVHQLSQAFKGKFLDSLKRALRKKNEISLFNDKIQQAYNTRWVVNCQASLASVQHVVKYLGQYTHRAAITNQRILNIDNDRVTFITKDYRDRAVKKPATLHGVEFLRRFTMHILPKRFVKIRRFGIYNPTVIRNYKLQFVPEENPASLKCLKLLFPQQYNRCSRPSYAQKPAICQRTLVQFFANPTKNRR